MNKFTAILFGLSLCLLASLSFAQEIDAVNNNAEVKSTKVENSKVENQQTDKASLSAEHAPQVGKHVMANMNASSMILSLLMVLGLIIISALVLKRFNLTQQNSNQLKVIANLSLGAKERVVVVQIGEQQLVLGVCPQQISLLKDLKTPIDIETSSPIALPGNVLSFLQKSAVKAEKSGNTTTNETTSNK